MSFLGSAGGTGAGGLGAGAGPLGVGGLTPLGVGGFSVPLGFASAGSGESFQVSSRFKVFCLRIHSCESISGSLRVSSGTGFSEDSTSIVGGAGDAIANCDKERITLVGGV